MKKGKGMGDRAGAVLFAGTVTEEPLHSLEHYWEDSENRLRWDCIFMLPPWLGVWGSHFGRSTETHLCVVRNYGTVLGLVPLTFGGDSARLISDNDLIDYSDFVIAPLREGDFFNVFVDYLRQKGVRRFTMERVRADSVAVSYLRDSSSLLGCEFSSEPVDVLYEMELPDSWEGYLALLTGRERHETRRKLARLESAGHVGLQVVEDPKDVSAAMDTFMALFRSDRREKFRFMTDTMESFFRSLAREMAEAGLFKLFLLDLNNIPAGAALCFDHRSTVYLYNNGYDRRFSNLSMGLMSKVFSIRESVIRKRRRYNFLRGGEAYKRRLGGRPLNLLRCEVILT
jgi:CelD/BcsL family acetyltransferase involved in cellulose biosynthesis